MMILARHNFNYMLLEIEGRAIIIERNVWKMSSKAATIQKHPWFRFHQSL